MNGKSGLMEKISGTMTAVKKNVKSGVVFLILVIITVVSIVIAIRQTLTFGRLQNEKKDLAVTLENTSTQLEDTTARLTDTTEELTAAQSEVELLQDTTESLHNQVNGLNATIDELNNKIEDLLNIEDTLPVITRTQLAEQLNSIGELATLRYIYTNANREEGSKTWLWGWTMPFSDTSLLVTYDGTIKAGINLSDVTFDINERNRTITVTLPHSKVLDNYIPQETINVLEVKDGFFNRITFDDYNQFIAKEKLVMEEKAIERGMLTDADNEAKALIEAFLKSIPGMDTYKLVIK